MEFEEHGHKNGNYSIEHVSYLDHNIGEKHLLVFTLCAEVISIKAPLDAFKPGKRHCHDDEVGHNEHINEQ